jgi:hypothetical protein
MLAVTVARSWLLFRSSKKMREDVQSIHEEETRKKRACYCKARAALS